MDSVKVNEHLVKISAGYISTEKPLSMDEEVSITIEGSIVKIEDKSNQNGTVDRVYTVKGITLESKHKQLINDEFTLNE